MRVTETNLPGVLIIEPKLYKDERGYFKENFQVNRYLKIGVNYKFVQDNLSHSKKNVLRGLHFQKNKPQGKLISCYKGIVFDVVVDINPHSQTFKKWFGMKLTGDNHKQLWIPPGYAHGFCVLSDEADFHYKCTDYYDHEDESGLIWNDDDIAIQWPIQNPILSKKDQENPKLKELIL